MRASFDHALKFVLDHENVYERGHYGDYNHVLPENVAGDAGGLTKFGIDQASHPDVNIRQLNFDQARQIYLDEYWLKIRGDDLPAGFDTVVFDIAVNNGKGTAILLLQRALNSTRATSAPSLTEDGHIGPKTISRAIMDAHDGSAGLEKLLQLREQRYRDIVANHPSQHKFLNGWLDRNNDLTKFVQVA